MSKKSWHSLAQRLATLGGTTACERGILAGILSGLLTEGDRRCLLAMSDRHIPQSPKVSPHTTLKINQRLTP